MHKFLSRTATAAAVTVALLSGTLLTAPAANAASHKIDGDLKHTAVSVKVGGHRDVISLDSVGKASTRVALNGEVHYYAAKYKVSLKHGKHVLYRKESGTYRSLLAAQNALVTKHTTDAALKAIVKRTLSIPEREAKAGVSALVEQINNEAAGLLAAAEVLADAKSWLADHPGATSFDGFTPRAEDVHVGEGLGVDVKLVGTPAAFKVEATVAANGAVLSIDSNYVNHYSKLSLYGQLVKNAPRVVA